MERTLSIGHSGWVAKTGLSSVMVKVVVNLCGGEERGRSEVVPFAQHDESV